MRSIDSHSIPIFVKNDSTSCCVIDYLALGVISNVISCIIASITINISYVKIHIWNLVLRHFLSVSQGTHLITDFNPSICRLKLIPFFLNCLELISFLSKLVIEHFFLKLFRRFSCEPEMFHPQSTMIIVFEH